MKKIADELRRLADELEKSQKDKDNPKTLRETLREKILGLSVLMTYVSKDRPAEYAINASDAARIATNHAVAVVTSLMADNTECFFNDKAYALVVNRVRDALRASSGVDSPTSEGCDD